MGRRTLFGLVGLAATLIFALPIALLGAQQLVAGRPIVGVGMLVVAGLMILFGERLGEPAGIRQRLVAGFGEELPESDPED